MTKDLVLMAKIGAAHGMHGSVRVKSFTGDPLALGDYGPLVDAAGNTYDVADIRSAKTVVVVRFKQVAGRQKAEALNGTELFIARDQLPDEELEPDEFFIEDLIGLKCVSRDGATLGHVTSVLNFGANDIVEVQLQSTGKKELFAFDALTFPDVDLEAGLLTLVPPGVVVAKPGNEVDERS